MEKRKILIYECIMNILKNIYIARFFWKIIKIIIIEHYMSILGVIYNNVGILLEGCLTVKN